MAIRPVFVPGTSMETPVLTINTSFTWYPGMALAQRQRSIQSMHECARVAHGLSPLLEISTRSPEPHGVALSAFNLELAPQSLPGYAAPAGEACPGCVTVEALFQSSKVFADGGPFPDMLGDKPRDIKKDPRIRATPERPLRGFRLAGTDWPLEPATLFYDWIYLNALLQNPGPASRLDQYAGFTDMAFNPRRAVNCQAASAALYCALRNNGLLEEALCSPDAFRNTVYGNRKAVTQLQLDL